MRNIYTKSLLTVAVLLLAFGVAAQESLKESLVVPLSDPGAPGKLHVALLYGSIRVAAHQGKDVVIASNQRVKKKEKEQYKDGLRKISNNSSQYSVEEYNNKVIVKSGIGNKSVDFEIKVPKDFALELRTVNNGNIYVEGVNGEMEISNTNGAITLKNVAGSVIADALNKDIVVDFTSITPSTPMAFTSLNGNLDVTFPTSLKATIKARTENGDIFTDFDIEQSLKSETINNRSKSGVYKVTVDKWVGGTINGGGPEMLFKTLNGDILIRSR
ncbi:MAG: DUF4097 family beta strand repeat-containing protein [Flavobacteriaceae bacterium]